MIDMTGSTPAVAAGTSWFTSSYSVNATDCVEVRFSGDAVLIRDSKNRAHGPTLAVTTTAWAAFLEGLRSLHWQWPAEPVQGVLVALTTVPGRAACVSTG